MGHLEMKGMEEVGEVEEAMGEGEVALEVTEGLLGAVGSGEAGEGDTGEDGETLGCLI